MSSSISVYVIGLHFSRLFENKYNQYLDHIRNNDVCSGPEISLRIIRKLVKFRRFGLYYVYAIQCFMRFSNDVSYKESFENDTRRAHGIAGAPAPCFFRLLGVFLMASTC